MSDQDPATRVAQQLEQLADKEVIERGQCLKDLTDAQAEGDEVYAPDESCEVCAASRVSEQAMRDAARLLRDQEGREEKLRVFRDWLIGEAEHQRGCPCDDGLGMARAIRKQFDASFGPLPLPSQPAEEPK